MTNLATSIPFVTGSNRGLGRALVDALLGCGVPRLYAASRSGAPHPDARVIPIRLDVTNHEQIAAAAAVARDATLLINNAGSLASYSVLSADRAQLAQDLDINFHGPLALVRALLPVLKLTAEAAIVNVLSVVSLASMPAIGGYAASKAAAWSLT
ncbi:MAG TPA: SDR family NAD(P)-dependent oxidoreductase, partial [Polyangiaceae bacterium]|nr:SDR family NAD(P)-dependent oxidoreductase [Polyangiaceae bacterium]